MWVWRLRKVRGEPSPFYKQCTKNSKDSNLEMSKLSTMKSFPGWVSQKKSQVEERRTLPVVVPRENMEIQEHAARSIGAIYNQQWSP